METENIQIRHALNGGEYFITGTKYRADGYLPPSKEDLEKDPNCKGTIYEFHGDFYHGNPRVYNLEHMNVYVGKTFGELNKKTEEKRAKIISLGYKYVETWEYDFKEKQREINNNIVADKQKKELGLA